MEEFDEKKNVLINIKKYIGNFYNFVSVENERIDTSSNSEILETIKHVISKNDDKLPFKNMYCFVQIYEYLYSSYNKSLMYYSQKKKDIDGLRNYYKTVKDFRDVKSVYKSIRQGIDEYTCTLKNLELEKNHKIKSI